jgi:cell division septal protein FtsQ
MATDISKTTHADEVRRRRSQTAKQRRTAAARAASTIRPLVSHPRVTGAPGSASQRSRGRRGFEFSLARAGVLLALPTLPRVRGGWRLVSGSMVLLLLAMLTRLVTDPRMYVKDLNLGGAALVPGKDIFAASGISRQHIFWVNPAEVQQRIAALSGIDSAQVSVQWPAVVTVVVKEKVPVVKWLEGDQVLWVNAQGEKFQARSDIPGLLPIQVDDVKAAGEDYVVPLAAIQGALQLRQLRPNIELLHYDTEHGLSYQDGRNWRGYFGVGTDMGQKLAVYESLVDNLLARGIHPAMISVVDVRAPYYRK